MVRACACACAGACVHVLAVRVCAQARETREGQAVEQQAGEARGALAELCACVRELSAQRGAVGPLLDALARAIARLSDHR